MTKRNKFRKLPNSLGSITKLSGNRRKPFLARAPATFQFNEDCTSGKYIRKTIGCAETWDAAYKLLLDYKASPYDLENKDTTLREVYEGWSKQHYPTISDSSEKGYKAAYAILKPIESTPFQKLRAYDFEDSARKSGKNGPTLKRYKTLINLLYKYAIKYEITNTDYSDVVDLSTLDKNPNKHEKKIFSKKEISTLWEHADNRTVRIILMLIYSGLRIEEMLDLKKQDVHLDDNYINIERSKTENGIRQVPIAKKVKSFYEEFMKEEGYTDHLILNSKRIGYSYSNFRKIYWNRTLESLGMDHTPHETRHTCTSMLAEAKVDPRTIKKILGHAGAMDLTERVYTHLDIKTLLDAINMI